MDDENEMFGGQEREMMLPFGVAGYGMGHLKNYKCAFTGDCPQRLYPPFINIMQGPALSPTLDFGGTILAHCGLELLGSSDPPELQIFHDLTSPHARWLKVTVARPSQATGVRCVCEGVAKGD
ncbi:uncharacterized protein LOC117981491 isoform X2 [Pan paniscus]|uniref:uncharacterized protein LOC117981491 isoform X2 n=1 Tax=Pan paniscus TaxID=9597 RepID=UPI003004E769